MKCVGALSCKHTQIVPSQESSSPVASKPVMYVTPLMVCITGNLVYHGPRENVMEFFESLGFACPERKGIADFLQEVTSRKDQKVPLHLFCLLLLPECARLWKLASQTRHLHIGQFVIGKKGYALGHSIAAPCTKATPTCTVMAITAGNLHQSFITCMHTSIHASP